MVMVGDFPSGLIFFSSSGANPSWVRLKVFSSYWSCRASRSQRMFCARESFSLDTRDVSEMQDNS